MSKIYSVPAEVREDVGKGASRRLRRENKVPAVVYGSERDPVTLTLEHNFIIHAVEDEAFHSSVLELKVGKDRRQKVVLRDLQRHPFKPRVMHVDFQRVSDDVEIRLNVPLHFINAEKSEAGKQAGIVISHQINEVEVKALPKNLPEFIEVDLAALEPGESVMLSDLVLPEGVTITLLDGEEEFDAPTVTAIFVRASQGTGELADEADAALAEGAEPEAIEQGDEPADEDDEEGEDEDGKTDSDKSDE